MYNTKQTDNDSQWEQFDDNSYINDVNGVPDVAFHRSRYGAPQQEAINQADFLRHGGWIRI